MTTSNANPNETLLRAENIDKEYRLGSRRLPILREVCLTVKSRQTLAISGPSGAGKTTLLHVLSGLDRPTQGRVYHRDIEVYAMPPARRTRWRARDVGFIFQTYHLLPELSILENVMLPIVAAGGRMNEAARQRSRQMLERVGLAERLDHTPSTLSGGEQQRAAIARALINNPEIVFADEPTGNLDTATGENILRCLLDMTGHAERALIMVTHNPEIAERCDRRLHLVDGMLSEAD